MVNHPIGNPDIDDLTIHCDYHASGYRDINDALKHGLENDKGYYRHLLGILEIYVGPTNHQLKFHRYIVKSDGTHMLIEV